jgi:uncharacterized protein (DUF433 family)
MPGQIRIKEGPYLDGVLAAGQSGERPGQRREALSLNPRGSNSKITDMNTSPNTWRHLAPNPKSAYKQLFIKGTRIRARVLYGWCANEEEPFTPEQIATDFNLPVDAVLEAIAYCESNPPELLEDYLREEANADASGENDPNYKYHPQPKSLKPEDRQRIYGPRNP